MPSALDQLWAAVATLPLPQRWVDAPTEHVHPAPGPFRFLDLPRELRDVVYRLVLSKGTTDLDYLDWLSKHGSFSMSPALLDVNRQVCSEAHPIFYQVNTFRVEDPEPCFSFLYSRPTARANIRSLLFEMGYENCESQFLERLCNLLGNQCQLQHLDLHITFGEGRHSADAARLNEFNTGNIEVIGWLQNFLQIKNLRTISLSWSTTTGMPLNTPSKLANSLRVHMLLNGAAKTTKDCTQIRFRHYGRYGRCFIRRIKTRGVDLKMDARGKLAFKSLRRVKAIPCRKCGNFQLPPGERAPAHYDLEVFNSERNICTYCRPLLDLDDDPWFTKEDLFRSRLFAESGYTLVEQPPKRPGDYANSDFGDTDSLLSVNFWDDNEDAELEWLQEWLQWLD